MMDLGSAFFEFLWVQPHKNPTKRAFNQLISWKTCGSKTGFIQAFGWSVSYPQPPIGLKPDKLFHLTWVWIIIWSAPLRSASPINIIIARR